MRQLIIRKLTAAYLIALAVCHIVGTWQALHAAGDPYLAVVLMQRSPLGGDVFTLMAHMLFAGFGLLWIILLIRKRIARRGFLIFLLLTNLFGAFWLWFMTAHGTWKGFDTAVTSTAVILGFNALFTLSYLVSRTD